MIRKAIRDHLLGDVEVTSRLATYQFDPSTLEAAIFTTFVLPNDASFPAIVIIQTGAERFETQDSRGADVDYDVLVLTGKDRSGQDEDELAKRVWQRLDRAKMTTELEAEGWQNWGVRAEFPTSENDADEFPGYLIALSCRVLQEIP